MGEMGSQNRDMKLQEAKKASNRIFAFPHSCCARLCRNNSQRVAHWKDFSAPLASQTSHLLLRILDCGGPEMWNVCAFIPNLAGCSATNVM